MTISLANFSQGASRSRKKGRLAGLAAAGLVTFLVAFHGLLLWQRLADSSLLQPAVASRWLMSVLLLLALAKLRRLGAPLLWGRRALVFWLVVLILHAAGPAGMGAVAVVQPPLALPAEVALALLLVALIALVAGALVRDAAPSLVGRVGARPSRSAPTPHTAFFPTLFSRPPPVSP